LRPKCRAARVQGRVGFKPLPYLGTSLVNMGSVLRHSPLPSETPHGEACRLMVSNHKGYEKIGRYGQARDDQLYLRVEVLEWTCTRDVG
jgi:hypothetical protein